MATSVIDDDDFSEEFIGKKEMGAVLDQQRDWLSKMEERMEEDLIDYTGKKSEVQDLTGYWRKDRRRISIFSKWEVVKEQLRLVKTDKANEVFYYQCVSGNPPQISGEQKKIPFAKILKIKAYVDHGILNIKTSEREYRFQCDEPALCESWARDLVVMIGCEGSVCRLRSSEESLVMHVYIEGEFLCYAPLDGSEEPEYLRFPDISKIKAYIDHSELLIIDKNWESRKLKVKDAEECERMVRAFVPMIGCEGSVCRLTR